MRLDAVEVTGFKSIRELKLKLRRLNVLIGANGAGKSNFIALFRLLNEIMEQRFQLFVRQQGGANVFLHFGQKNTERITISLTFFPNIYECIWVPTVDDRLIFEQEICGFFGDWTPKHSESFGSGHEESKLPHRAQKERYTNVPDHVYNSLIRWKVYHFHDTSDSAHIKRIGDINDNLYLRPDGSNLAAFLYRLQQTAHRHYETIRDTIRMVAPFFDDFILRPVPENENKIRLEWREQGSDYPFLAHHLSDGTLRFMCLATLLLQPHLPFSTIVIDEPELGLHPDTMTVLASMMRSVRTTSQVIVSTQSVSLVNQFDPEDLLVVERREGATVIEALEPQRLSAWLEEYSLGELWEKNVLGGRPSR